MYDVIIIGAGPAGLTASIYTCRARKKTLVLEAITYGGQIINAKDIENYPAAPHISGYEFSNNLYNQAKELGAEVVFEKAIDIKDLGEYKEIITPNNVYKSKTIIIATGSENRKLGLENETSLIGKGISYCATCDGPFYKDKEVAIQGGGNTAVEDALYLSDIAKTVYIIHRNNEFRADASIVDKIKEKNNIKIILDSNVTKLITNNNGTLESIEITNKEKEIKKIEVSALFIAVGRVPENENFRKIIKLNEQGYIIAGEDCKTNVEGIFVAGDNRVKKLRQLVTATSDGAVAATEAIKYINDNIKNQI